MTTSIHCKVDAEVKKQAEAVFKEAGLNTSTAINLFLKQAVIFKGIPFPIYTEKHNELNKLNELLETRELTGQMPETMPIGSELLGYK